MAQIERIIEITSRVYSRYSTIDDCRGFKGMVDTIPTYVLFSREMIERMKSEIYKTESKQDSILSMLMDIIMYLKIDGLKVERFRREILSTYRDSVNSSFLSKVLRRLIRPKEDIVEDNILLAIYLLKMVED